MNKDKSRAAGKRPSQQEIAEALDQELNLVLYAVSHDLRAPIRSIEGFSQAVIEDYADKLDDDGKDFLARVHRSCEALNGMIDDLLVMSRATRGELNTVEVDLTAEALRIFEQLKAAEPGRRVAVDVAPGLTAEADPKMASLALEHLLGNAWKFTSGREDAAISLGLDPDTGEFLLTDNGAGMDMDYARRRLFAPFQRMHQASEFPGRGMGLATAKRIFNRHGGVLRLDSSPGQGCWVWFSF